MIMTVPFKNKNILKSRGKNSEVAHVIENFKFYLPF